MVCHKVVFDLEGTSVNHSLNSEGDSSNINLPLAIVTFLFNSSNIMENYKIYSDFNKIIILLIKIIFFPFKTQFFFIQI